MNPLRVTGLGRYLVENGLLGWQALRLARELADSEWQPLATLEQLQLARLQSLLEQARLIPFYQSWLPSAGRGTPTNPRDLLRHLPILSKAVIRQNTARMIHPGLSEHDFHWSVTGGSTGEPLRLVQNHRTRVMAQAAMLRALGWLDLAPGDPHLVCRGFDSVSRLGHWRERLGGFRLLDTVAVDRLDDAEIVRQVRAFRPAYATGYPTSLLALARILHGSGLRIPRILCTAEMLSPAQREFLADTFAGRVADYYGSNEIGAIAFECQHGNKHLTEEHVLVETVDDHGHPVWDRPGRILVTDLDNSAMPLLRYDLGDIGILTRETCPCGRAHRVLRQLEGRPQDCLRNARGDVLPAMVFAEHSRHLQRLRAFQWEQRDLATITLRYVASGPDHEFELEHLVGIVTRQLGPDMHVVTEACHAIPLTPRGKTRLVVGLPSAPIAAAPTSPRPESVPC